MHSSFGEIGKSSPAYLDVIVGKLAYLKDSNAAAHSVDSNILQSTDSSIRALQDLTLTFIS